MARQPKVGDPVVFVTPEGEETGGVLVNVFGPVCANVAFVSTDPARTDPNGRQIERQSSCSRLTSERPVRGQSWFFPEERNALPSFQDCMGYPLPAST